MYTGLCFVWLVRRQAAGRKAKQMRRRVMCVRITGTKQTAGDHCSFLNECKYGYTKDFNAIKGTANPILFRLNVVFFYSFFLISHLFFILIKWKLCILFLAWFREMFFFSSFAFACLGNIVLFWLLFIGTSVWRWLCQPNAAALEYQMQSSYATFGWPVQKALSS